MKKKILVIAMVAALAVMAIAGASLAYFTDTETETNTMVIGNVDITIEEKMYDADKSEWVDYEDEMVLYPMTQAKAPFNKAVRTYNTSESGNEVYIRTIIALPANLYNYVGLGFNTGDKVTDAEGDLRYGVDWDYAGDYAITEGGEKYSIFVCTVKDGEAVGEGDYMLSLTKVWLYETVTQDDIVDLGLIDANGVAQFQVEVLSQGIQTAALTHEEAMSALGEITESNLIAWFAK